MEDLESLGDAFFDMVHKQVKASGMPMKDKSVRGRRQTARPRVWHAHDAVCTETARKPV